MKINPKNHPTSSTSAQSGKIKTTLNITYSARKGTAFDEPSTYATITTTWPDIRPTAIRNRTWLALSGILFVALLSTALLWEITPLGRETRIQDTPNTDFQYAGMYTHQPSSGLELMPMRAYDPTPGRWLERDPEPGDAEGDGEAESQGRPMNG